MLKYITRLDHLSGNEWIETSLTGKQLLSTALLNKGTAFTEEERIELKLLGKLPFRIETLEEQLKRAKNQFRSYTNTLQKYVYLNNLHDKNEILFYKLLLEDIHETLPLIYTPGVSAAVKEFSQAFQQPRGIYISYPDRAHLAEILDNRTHANIDLVVVTDGERILGIGDQGIGGMDIPIAKLVVYSLCGVNPYRSLPIFLDVGTDNPQLLADPLYLGWRHPRIRGVEYDDFIDDFVEIFHEKFPTAFLHWEDFGLQNARKILETYRLKHCSFNDDMQGTGVVTLAAILSAVEATKVPLEDHRVIVFGAGTAGVGISDQLYSAMLRQGIDPDVARRQFWLVDRQGLLVEGMENLQTFQVPYARPLLERKEWPESRRDLLSIVKAVHPTILIGCSTQGGAFTADVIKTMAKHVQQPIILPLSNPNENCEALPEQIIQWTSGKAFIATGSPFEPVHFNGRHYNITQCNNALSFPGIGLGVIATKATQLTDNMLWAATQAICQFAPIRTDKDGTLLPEITKIAELAPHVAIAVAKQAIADKVAREVPTLEFADFVRDNIWKPYYRQIRKME